ncbi:RodZ domain-containing protein [Methylophaga sulfidovorans]|uniref:Cytoskeleton protein RodZ n=1 Tax=Methylophaga sulfidovorans TaxID=45496 RepID=A0A1I4BHU6_9GAMM|nr:helix-turn-helix domain-containing protein [Methylophaga sulfidovorans]SFK67870.1 cytoskeleton protein RodZ [Methylophaga sulfidovorans]
MSDLNDDFVVTSNTPSLGARLQQARENKKLSIAEVATQLRLTRDIIIYLENQQWDRLHGRTYARGYSASYVKFLGLPQEEMLAVFNDEYVLIDNEPRLVKTLGAVEQKPFPWLMIVLLLVGVFIIWSAYQQWQISQTSSSNEVDEVGSVSPDKTELDKPADKETITIQESVPESSDLLPENDAAEVSESDNNAIDSTEDIQINDTATATSQPAEEAKQNILKMSFSGDCWVEVTDTAMNVLLSQVMKAKQSVELKSELPMKILLGKADFADVTYNSKPVDLAPYTQGNVAKLTLGAQS